MWKRLSLEYLELLRALLRMLALVTPIGALVGSACALFLWLLDRVTELRWAHGWLLFLLPVAGMGVALLYRRFGHGAGGGNNLIVDEIHAPGAGVPARLAPLVLVGTALTHLCGGSAGREGTAVQMGGSIASLWARLLGRVSAAENRTLLMTGVAAGFGGVFGTPLAGAVFALEVPALGRMSYTAALPCLLAAVVADRACALWGIHHTQYPQLLGTDLGATGLGGVFDWLLLGKVVAAGAIFGLASRLFSGLAHRLADGFRDAIWQPVLRPLAGGVLVIGMTFALGTDYLGLGVSSPDPSAVTILSAFHEGGATTWSWLWKVLFTAVTLGAAFKGGEVTPLFFIGATLGNTLALPLDAPTPLFAALGFAAVFAGATNTPLACTLMAAELFGTGHLLHFAAACFTAYACSGHSGIYLSQRIGAPKRDDAALPPESTLRTAHERHHAPREQVVLQPGPVEETTEGAVPMKGDEAQRGAGGELGQLRIYLTRAAKGRPATGWRRLFGVQPLYAELIAAAKAEGIAHASAHHAHHGYSGAGAIAHDRGETPNSHLTLHVELIDERAKLEAFCRAHREQLAGRVLLYKHVEHWELHAPEVSDGAGSNALPKGPNG